MKGNHLIIVNADDWEVLYVNGLHEYEHHHVPIDFIADFVPIISLKRYGLTDRKAYEWFDERGTFPIHFDEIPKEYIE